MPLLPGDPLPTFIVPGVTNPRYALDTAAGRYLLIAFVPAGRAEAAMTLVRERRAVFDDLHASAFVVVVGEDPEREGRRDALPGLRHLFDAEGGAAGLYGAGERELWVLADPQLHVLAIGDAARAAYMIDRIGALPPPPSHGGFEAQAPVLMTPRIFERPFCEALIAAYRRQGGTPSGIMRQVGDKTHLVMNDAFKKRSDVLIEDAAMRKAIVDRLNRRLVPQIEKAFNFKATRLERYLVASYNAETGGYFRPHRDNTTVATRHGGSRSPSISTTTTRAATCGFRSLGRAPIDRRRAEPASSPARSCTRRHR